MATVGAALGKRMRCIVERSNKVITRLFKENKDAAARLLLEARDVNGHEARALSRKIVKRDASDADKWAYARHLYKQSWDIDLMDAEFLEAHGASSYRPESLNTQRH